MEVESFIIERCIYIYIYIYIYIIILLYICMYTVELNSLQIKATIDKTSILIS